MPQETSHDDVPESADALFGVPLSEFTEGRNALARELKAGGRGSEARAVKALRKPRVPAWAVNQLARERSDSITDLVEVTERMTTSLDTGDDFRQAGDKRHELIKELTDAAAALLEDAGISPTSSVLREVAQTLQAATTPEQLSQLQRGVLTEPLQAAGFTSVPSLEPRPNGDRSGEADREAGKELEELNDRLAEARGEVEAKTRSADQADRRAQAARRELEVAERALERLQDRIDKEKNTMGRS